MKIIYAIALPTVLAVTQHSVMDLSHPCERGNEHFDPSDCLQAMYKEFNQMLKGNFPKEMKQGIKKIVRKSSNRALVPTTPSPVTPSATPIPCSMPEQGAGPCAEGNYCKHEYNPMGGECNVCPADGEECSAIIGSMMGTVQDYRHCCEQCPNAACDVNAYTTFLSDNTKPDWKGKQPVIMNIMTIIPTAEKLGEFMPWMYNSLEDTKRFPGNVGADIILGEDGTVKTVTKWESEEAITNYTFWRLSIGIFPRVNAFTDNQFSSMEAAFEYVENFGIWRGW